MIAKSGKPYGEGDFIKRCPEKTSLFKDISLTINTVSEQSEDISLDLNQQLKDASARFEHFSIASDASGNISGIAQLEVFIRACDSDLHIIEECSELIPMHDTTTSQEICEKVEQLLREYGQKDSEVY